MQMDKKLQMTQLTMSTQGKYMNVHVLIHTWDYGKLPKQLPY